MRQRIDRGETEAEGEKHGREHGRREGGGRVEGVLLTCGFTGVGEVGALHPGTPRNLVRYQ